MMQEVLLMILLNLVFTSVQIVEKMWYFIVHFVLKISFLRMKAQLSELIINSQPSFKLEASFNIIKALIQDLPH